MKTSFSTKKNTNRTVNNNLKKYKRCRNPTISTPLFPYPLTTTSPVIYATHYTICGKSIIQFEGVLLYNLWICAAPSRRTCQTCQTCRTIRTGWGGGLEGWGKIKKRLKIIRFSVFWGAQERTRTFTPCGTRT